MKKILNITSISVFPPNNGGSALVFNFLKYLSRYYDISLITVMSDDKSKRELSNVDIFDVLNKNSLIKFLSPATFFKLFQITRTTKPDFIIIDFPWFGIYGILLNKLFNIPYIIHEHNIEFLRFRRLNKWWWKILKTYEKLVFKRASKIFYISEVDKRIIIDHFKIESNKLIYVPYGVDTDRFKPNQAARNLIRQKLGLRKNFIVLFFGSLDYKPNKEALEIISNEIAPRAYKKDKNVKFLIVGKNPPSNLNGVNIILTGSVDRIEDYINASDVVVVPLKTGGGVRTKIIESIACGKRVICTKPAAEGIDLQSFQHHIIIYSSLNNLLTLIKESKKLSSLKPPSAIKDYDIKKISKKLSLYE